MPKIDISSIPGQVGSTYPEPFNAEMEGRTQYRLGKHAGLTQFGANLVRLAHLMRSLCTRMQRDRRLIAPFIARHFAVALMRSAI